jgi:hypothetical protein
MGKALPRPHFHQERHCQGTERDTLLSFKKGTKVNAIEVD